MIELPRLRRLLYRIGDVFPPTVRGLFLAAVSGLALWRYGFGHLDLVLYVLGIAGIVLLGLTSLLVGGTALWLRRRVPKAPGGDRRLEAGSPIPTGFELPALAWLPLVKVRWEWLAPANVEVRPRPRDKMLREMAVAKRRGQAGAIRRRMTVEDPFGLTRVAFTATEPTAVTILPAVGSLKNMHVIQSMTAQDGLPHPSGAPEGDRMEIRRYQPGDPVRHILWKTFARTRQLNVRIPELAIDRSQKTIAYLVAGEGDEAAAAAARVALESGTLGDDWIFGADGTHGPIEELAPALQAIARSGSVSEDGDAAVSALGSFLREVGQAGETHGIVFVPAHLGPWLDAVLEAAAAYPGALSFVVGTDGIRRDRPEPLWRRFLFAEEPTGAVYTEELGKVLGRLTATGGPTLVADRPSGRVYDQGRQNALAATA